MAKDNLSVDEILEELKNEQLLRQEDSWCYVKEKLQPYEKYDTMALLEEILGKSERVTQESPEIQVRSLEELEPAAELNEQEAPTPEAVELNEQEAQPQTEATEESTPTVAEEVEATQEPTPESEPQNEPKAEPPAAVLEQQKKLEKYQTLQRNRAKQVESFVLQRPTEQWDPAQVTEQTKADDPRSAAAQATPPKSPQTPAQATPPAPPEPQYSFDDYSQAEQIAQDLLHRRRRGRLRTLLCLGFFALSGLGQWLALVPTAMGAQRLPLLWGLIWQLAVMAGLQLVCLPLHKEGIGKLMQGKPTLETAYSASLLLLGLQQLLLLFSPRVWSDDLVHLYLPAACLVMAGVWLSRWLYANEQSVTFDLWSKQQNHTALCVTRHPDSLKGTGTPSLPEEEPCMVYPKKTTFLRGFSVDLPTAVWSKTVSLWLCIGLGAVGLLCAILMLVRGESFHSALTAATGVLLVCSGTTGILVSVFPLFLGNRKAAHRQQGGILTEQGVKQLAEAQSVLVRATDLFKAQQVVLYGIKTFSDTAIDRAILDAASVLYHAKSVLSGVFLQVIGAHTDYLAPVDGLLYEDGLGLSAWVSNRRVLIGTKELMQHHNIEVPSQDYEKKYVDDTHQLVYLSCAGKLSAVFSLEVKPSAAARSMLARMHKQKMRVIFQTFDPFLTDSYLAELFDLPASFFFVVPSLYHKELDALLEGEHQAEDAAFADAGSLSYVSLLLQTKKLAFSFTAGLGVHLFSIGLAAVFFLLFSCFGGMEQLGNGVLCLYQIIMTLLCLGIQCIGRGR